MNLRLRIANYISRYAPSKKKLIEYISKKNHTFPISDFIQEIGYSEDLMLDMWMRTFLTRSTGEKDVQIKLLKKGFPKDAILEKIRQHHEEMHDWSNHVQEIEGKIDTLIRKGKSSQSISILLGGKYPYFQDEIRNLLSSRSDQSGLVREIQKYKTKYDISHPSEKQKFYAALQRKGFRYEDIKNWLKKEAEEA